jgi:hypothetical protein
VALPVFYCLVLPAQEVCDNGIDDAAYRLIDLNDIVIVSRSLGT